MPEQSNVPVFRPTRRAVARSAAWTVPAVAIASAAPAYAATGAPTLTTAWALTTDSDIAFTQAGDLVWTVGDADLAAGSTVTLVVSDPNGNLENYIWVEALSGLTGVSIGAHNVPQGGSTTLTLTTTSVVPVGSTFSITLGPENSSTGSYSVAWTVDPANPTGANLTGSVAWSAAGGFTS